MVQPAFAHRPDQRGTFDQLFPAQGKQAAFGHAAERVSGPANPLQKCRDRARRAELAHQIDVADVDAQLKRRRRHHRLQAAVLQALLRALPASMRQAAVMRLDVLLSQSFGELMSDALGQFAGVDKNQRAAMLVDELHQPLVDLRPMLVGTNGLELHPRHFDAQIHIAKMADVHDARHLGGCSHQKLGQFLHRLLRSAQADAHGWDGFQIRPT